MDTNFLKEPRKEGITDDEWIWKRNMNYIGLDMYREWKKIGFPKEYCI